MHNVQAHVKEQIALSPHTAFRGYQQLGANVTRYDGGFQRDWHEAIDLYKEELDTVRTHWPFCSYMQHALPTCDVPMTACFDRIHLEHDLR